MQFGLEPSSLMEASNSASVGDDRWYSVVGVEWCGFAALETRSGQRRLDAVIAARRAVARDMETGQGSGGQTCGETTANLTRDDYKQR